MAEPQPDMLAHALEAYDAGLCIVKAKADGTKRPDGAWLQYQAQRPTRQQVIEWFKDGWPAMGTICGAVSGDLEMFELEGRFVTEIGTKAFMEAMLAAGHGDLLARLRAGILAISPSNGRHFIYRVDGPVDGNTKLAQRDATPTELAINPDDRYKTMIETRGEGGFVMLAPSHGTSHPTGKAWRISEGSYATIPTITVKERTALFDVARGFHTANPTPTAPPRPSGKTTHITRHTGTVGQWFDTTVEHVKQTVDMRALLEQYGWTYEYTDRHGRDMLKRPGKDTDGISASINGSGRLLLFSTSTGFVAYSGPGAPTPTYDQLDIIAYYEHGNDRKAAAKHIAEQTGILDAWKRAKDDETANALAITPPARLTADGEITAPADDTDDSFWLERPALEHILTASRSRLVGPYAVLGCVLARVAAFTPASTCIPPTIGGGMTPLSLYVALRARSGGGKSSPAACANDLLPHTPPGCVGPLALGSGEGLVEAFMELVEETDGGGKKTKVKRQVKRGALFMLDEGQMLAEIGSRKGSTILPVLRTAWSGGDPGQANASIETRRSLHAGSYTVGLISLWQDRSGASLIADADGGTPQRFIWLPTTDPGASKNRPQWPGELPWTPPAAIAIEGRMQSNPLDLAPEIIDEIVEGHIAVALHATAEIDPLDAHRRLNKLKIAGCLAVLEGRRNVDLDDWRIAERLMTLSDHQRDWVIAESRREAANRVSSEIAKAVMKDGAVEKSAADRALRNAAKAVYRAAESATGTASKRDLHHRIASRDRALVSVDDAIAEAVRLDWIKGNDTAGYVVGGGKPT
jgi:hypothetical protein